MPAIPTLPQRWHRAETLRQAGRDIEVPEGVFTDWQNDEVREYVYARRQQRPQPTMAEIADEAGFQHWLRVARASDAQARRVRADRARGNAEYRPESDHRRWARSQRNMRTNTGAAPARQGSRPDGSLVVRRFGQEIEFNRGEHRDSVYSSEADALRLSIVNAINDAGMTARVEGYNHQTRPYWKMTTDVTVSGGELVSPIMAGDTASLDEARDVLRIVKEQGGTPGRTVGMHIHIDCTDFTTPGSRRRLIDTLAMAQSPMSQFVPRFRTTGELGNSAGLLSGSEFDILRRAVETLVPGADGRGYRRSGYVDRSRFINVESPMLKYGTVEFRGLGNTLHLGKVRVWIRICQAVVEAAKQGVVLPMNATPAEFASALVDANLLGQRAASRFVAECDRRQGR